MTALVENGGKSDPGEIVTFRETLGSGTLTNTPTNQTIDTTADTAARQGGKQVTDVTDLLGRAQVAYDTGGNTGRAEVKASISVVTAGEVTTHLREIAFSIRGGSGGGDQNTILITLSSTTGEPGDEIDVRVTSDPSGESVNINSGELTDADFSGLLWSDAFHAYAHTSGPKKGSIPSPQPVQILLQTQRLLR